MLAQRLAEARRRLEAAGLSPADAALDAEVLARHVLGWDRATLLTRAREAEPSAFAVPFDALLMRREAREPVAQIVGHREFWTLDFYVTRDVIVPRPETELIVEEALSLAREENVRHVMDVGTGSGCLAIAIAHELRDVRVTATDISLRALEVAARNAARHGVTGRVDFRMTDVLQDVIGTADLIVSNPPYVPEREAESLQPEVIDYEPHAALFAGPTGLAVIERLFAEARRRLAPHGRLVVEFGFGQESQVVALAEAAGWHVVRIRKDLQSIPRTIVLARTPHG